MRISDWSSDVCSSDLRVDVGRPNIKGVLAPHAARRALQLVGERIGSVGIGLGVRHFKDAGDSAKHGSAAAGLKVFLLLQPRLAEVNLCVDGARKDDKTGAVDDLACIAGCADRGNPAVPHAEDRKSTRLTPVTNAQL